MAYKDYIDILREDWIGKKVKYGGEIYIVKNIDYNACLLIDKPSNFNGTTAVELYEVELL